MAWCMCIFMNCDLLFPAFLSSLFSIKHFQAKVLSKWQLILFWDKTLYSGNRLIIGHRFIEQAALSSFGWKKTSFPLTNSSRLLEQAHRLIEQLDVQQLSCCRPSNQKWRNNQIDQFFCAKEGQEWTVSTTTATVLYIITKILQKYSNFSLTTRSYKTINPNPSMLSVE